MMTSRRRGPLESNPGMSPFPHRETVQPARPYVVYSTIGDRGRSGSGSYLRIAGVRSSGEMSSRSQGGSLDAARTDNLWRNTRRGDRS